MASPGPGPRSASPLPTNSNNQTTNNTTNIPLPTAPVAFTSDELNYLIYRYLLESGFEHSAYSFGFESDVLNRLATSDRFPSARLPTTLQQLPTDLAADDPAAELKLGLERKEAMQRVLQHVQQGALVSIVQKGLQYVEVETHLMEDGTARPCATPLSLLHPHVCVDPTSTQAEALAAQAKARAKAKAKRKEKAAKANKRNLQQESDSEEKQAMPMEDVQVQQAVEEAPSMVISNEVTTVLEGHGGEVFVGAWWNGPKSLAGQQGGYLATGSGDGSARLWLIPPHPGSTSTQSVILENALQSAENKDVTTADWNPAGTMLVTGSYDGKARIWSFTPHDDPSFPRSESDNALLCNDKHPVQTSFGSLRHLATVSHHSGPVFSLRWNRTGTLLLSGSMDKTCVVFDPLTGDVRGKWLLHEAPALDVDWMPSSASTTTPGKSDIFASCSSDQTIRIVGVWNTDSPLLTLRGHTAEVNCVRWDPSGKYLASCGDDGRVFVWNWGGVSADGKEASGEIHRELVGHEREVYTVRWAPLGVLGAGRRVLATGSFDATVRLWDADSGECLHHLVRHAEPVYSIAFHPTLPFLAVGAFDQTVSIWSVEDGKLVRSFEGESGIFEVSWNAAGDRLAVCHADKKVVVIHADLIKLPGLS